MPDTCRARLLIEERVWLTCSANAGHPGTHTAYHGARLFEWPGPKEPTHDHR